MLQLRPGENAQQELARRLVRVRVRVGVRVKVGVRVRLGPRLASRSKLLRLALGSGWREARAEVRVRATEQQCGHGGAALT